VLALLVMDLILADTSFVWSTLTLADYCAQTGSGLTIAEPPTQDILPLIPNQPVEQELSAGKSHSYRIALQSGQYLRIMVDQWGIELSAALYQPDGQKHVGLVCRQDGPTPLSFIAEISGAYRLELSSLDKNSASGRYRVTLQEMRLAKPQDKNRVAAEKAFAEAEQLRAKWTSDFRRKAIKKYEEALLNWSAAGEKQEIADALKNVGEVFHSLGDTHKALKYYAHALRLSRETRDRWREAEILNAIGYVYVQLGEHQKAQDHCTQAHTLSQAVGNRRGEAQALVNIGEVHYYSGRVPKALEFYEQALPLWRTLSDRRGEAQTFLYLGDTYRDLGEPERASESYNRALSLWQAVNDQRGEALTLTAVGRLSSRLGEKQEALNYFIRALNLIRPLGDYIWEAATFNGVGYVYDELGDKQRALEYYSRALHLYRTVSLRKGEAGQLYRIGEVYHSLGDNQKALSYYQQALSIVRVLGDQRLESSVLRDIGVAYETLEDKTKALDYYNRALLLKRAGKDRRGEAYTLNNIGRIYDGWGEKQKALDYYNEALELNRAAGDRFGESVTLFNIARLERSGRGNLAKARSHLQTALKVIESLRTQAGSQDLRASYFASVRQHFELDIDLLMQLHKQQPSEGFEAAALQASERARARSLLESLTEARADIRQGVAPDLLEQERSLQRLLSDKAYRKVKLLSGKPNEAEAAAIAKEVSDLTNRYEEVQALIRSKSPRYAALTQPQPLGLSEIQQQVLDDQTLLLEYSLGDERSYLWAVSHTTITSHELPNRAEIEKPARRVYELLTARQPQAGDTPTRLQARVAEADTQYWQQADALSQILLGPVAGQLGTKRLLIVAEGALQYLPFGALPAPRSGTSEGPPVPLIVEHEIVSLPSASVLAVLRRETVQRNAATRAVAVLADPVFETDDPRLLRDLPKTTRRPSSNPGLVAARRPPDPTSDLYRALRDVGVVRDGLGIPRLPSTRIEADAIMAITPEGTGMKAIDFQANRATATSSELGQYRIVHFATHGLFNSEHPELSGIVLSLVDEQGKPQDGFLRLHDIYNLNLPVDLVVLSACNTGLGKDVKGEGLVGIVRGFMYAGAARVVASLWKVDDEATAELMKRFYHQILRAGQSPAAALRAAQTAMWQHKRWRSPYYWASFGLQGEWKGWSLNPG
jgi:CHAT domain-containing protein/Tfp pilus assembly protein PilF